MKKFTFIASLLLACSAITASAQTCVVKKFASQSDKITSVDQISDGGLYAFYSPSKKKYIKLSESNYQLNNDATLSNDDATDAFSVFKIHVITEGESQKYSFETAHANVYMKPVVDGDCYAEYTTTPATFEIRTTNVDGAAPSSNAAFCIKNSGDNKWFDMQEGKFVGWNGNGSNCGYDIIPVTVSDVDPTTYCYATHKMQLSDGTEITGYAAPFEAKYYADGTEMPETSPASCNYTVTLTNTSNVLASGNTEFVYEVTKSGEAPVTFSTADSKTWYNIFIFTNDNANPNATRTLKSTAEDNTLHVYTQPSAFTADDLGDYAGFSNAVWSFEEVGLGVKLCNKGTGKYLKWVSGFAELVDKNSATTLFITENTSDTGGFSGFGLWTGTGNQYLNASEEKNGVKNARLGVWNDPNSKNNHGSRFIVNAIDADLLAVGLECIKNPVPNEANATYVTAGVEGDIARAAAALEGVTATTWAELDAANATFTAELNKPLADIDGNAVYRIGSANVAASGSKYASIEQKVGEGRAVMPVGKDGTLATAYNANNNMDRKVYRTSNNADFMSQLWFIEANADGTFKFKSANAGSYWCNNAGSSIDMPTSKDYSGNFTFKSMPNSTIAGNDPKTMFMMLLDDTRVNAYEGGNGNYIQNYDGNHDNDKGNYWQIEKVTSIPVSIGETGYASVGYPFAVQLPEGDVKAYYASQAENGVMTLAEITDGLIPANTGGILVNESEAGGAASVTLTITTTDKTISGNKLVAANAKRIGFAEDENYLLAVDDDDKVKFLQATITTVPANKAYLPAANISGTNPANALAFSFGDDQTGINSIVKVGGNVKYYDLKGRRVLNPSNGVFITSDGKKVFIK